MDEAKIYIHLAHGGETGQYSNKRGLENLTVTSNGGVNRIPDDLSNIDLVIFMGCNTALQTGNTNMIEAAVRKGDSANQDKAAKVAIGFELQLIEVTPNSDTPYYTRYYQFINTFFTELIKNNSLEDTIRNNAFYKNGNFDSIKREYKEGVRDFSILPQD